MSVPNENQPLPLYIEYKALGRTIYAELDPEGKLRCCGLKRAKRIVHRLVEKFVKKPPKERLDVVYRLLEKAIALRTKCAKFYDFGMSQEATGHQLYIDFLVGIKDQLDVHKAHRKAAVGAKEQDQVDEEEQEQWDEEEREQVNEAGGVVDDDDDLTLDLLDFFTFLELLKSLAGKAAALWKEVAQGKLPIWVASTLSGVLLRDAEIIINETRLLKEVKEESRAGERTSKSPIPWIPNAIQPQLTQDWINALDKASDVGATWREFTAVLPFFWHYYKSMSFVLQWPKAGSKIEPGSEIFTPHHMPYAWTMLNASAAALHRSGTCSTPSSAQVPLATIVGLYFSRQALQDYVTDETTGLVNPKILNLKAARRAACAELNKGLAILPRLIKDNSVTKKEADTFRTTAAWLKAWARACTEQVSLGAIHVFARIHCVNWYAYITASNSAPLQAFLYLGEKWRLQAGGSGGDEYERLLGALMEDPRVAPVLWMNGRRPTTVWQCTEALQKWCLLPTEDGETLEWIGNSAKSAELAIKRPELIEHSGQVRRVDLVSRLILGDCYRLTKEIRDRVATREGKDGDALRRYLIWEMSAPNCLELEAALFRVLRRLPEWGEMLTASALTSLSREPKPAASWLKTVRDVIDHGLHALFNKNKWLIMVLGRYELSQSLQTAILKLALRTPGHEESLKIAFTNTFPSLASSFQGSFADELFQATMPEWQKAFNTLGIESLSEGHEVETRAYIFCLMPPNHGRNRGENKARNREKKSSNKRMRHLLKDVINEARPILEEVFTKSPARLPATSRK